MSERPRLEAVLEQLHTSEINAGVQSFFDSSWTAWLGDDMNGRRAEETFESIQDATDWLLTEARRQYPLSAFAAPDLHKPTEQHP